jgi:hypothetical protein
MAEARLAPKMRPASPVTGNESRASRPLARRSQPNINTHKTTPSIASARSTKLACSASVVRRSSHCT